MIEARLGKMPTTSVRRRTSLFSRSIDQSWRQRSYERPRALRYAGQQVAHEVGAAALPARARQRRRDRVDQAGVRVGGNQADAGKAAGNQAAQEGEPGGTVLARDDVESQRLPVAIAVDRDCVHDAGVDGAAALAALDLEPVQDEVRVGRAVERAGAELLDDRVQRLRQP